MRIPRNDLRTSCAWWVGAHVSLHSSVPTFVYVLEFISIYGYILLLQCALIQCFVQAKEAGADDILDISSCELTEVH